MPLPISQLRVRLMHGEKFITKPEQYASVYSKGNSRVNDLIVLKALPNGLTWSRYGLSISRRVGKAVTRNRIKRLFREILRLTPLQLGWDIIFIARPAAASADYARLKKSVNNLLSQAQLLRPLGNITFIETTVAGSISKDIYSN